MTRQDAERIITENLKPIFGFALKRCENTQDAEDLAQDIVLKAFRAFLIRDDIADPGKFLWTIAHNALSNYYRDGAKFSMGVPLRIFRMIGPTRKRFSKKTTGKPPPGCSWRLRIFLYCSGGLSSPTTSKTSRKQKLRRSWASPSAR